MGVLTSATAVLQAITIARHILLLITQATAQAPIANALSTAILLVGTAVGMLSYLSKARFLPAGIVTVAIVSLQVRSLAPHILLLITQATAQSPITNEFAIATPLVGTAAGTLSYLSKARFFPMGDLIVAIEVLQVQSLAPHILLLITQAMAQEPIAKSLSIAILSVGTAVGTLSYLSKARFLPVGIVTVAIVSLQVRSLAPHILLLITQATVQPPIANEFAIATLFVGTALGVLSYLSKARFLPAGEVTKATVSLHLIKV